MDEYIKREDALKIIDNYSKAVTEDGKVIVDAIRDIVAVITPTADVVPKSEVEELEKDRYQILPDGRLELLPRTDIDAVKAEVAREIFEEFERLMENNEVWFRQTDEIREDFTKLKKIHGGKNITMRWYDAGKMGGQVR